VSGARRLSLVIRREWNQRVRSNAFWISTVLSAAILVAIIAMPQILGGGADTSRTVGIVGENPTQLSDALTAAGGQAGIPVGTRWFEDRTTAESALRSGDVDVVLVDQRDLVWKADVDQRLAAVVTWAVQAVEQQRAIEQLHLTPAQVARLQPAALGSSSLEPVTAERDARLELAMIGVILLMLAISFYGGFLVVGVVEEKSSRVVEVLLSRLRPTELLSGKIAGIGLVGLAQLSMVAAAALVALAMTDDRGVPTTTAATIGWIVFWFILGYGFYAVLYGTAGSLVSRQEETQGITFPVTGLLLVAYFAAMQAVRAPDSVGALVASFVPPTAPMVMIVRVANGAVPWWQVALSAGLMVATIYVLVLFAGRVYWGAALRLGRRVKLMEAWRGAEATG
jgi:ABC-2 type transport system permease protein